MPRAGVLVLIAGLWLGCDDPPFSVQVGLASGVTRVLPNSTHAVRVTATATGFTGTVCARVTTQHGTISLPGGDCSSESHCAMPSATLVAFRLSNESPPQGFAIYEAGAAGTDTLTARLFLTDACDSDTKTEAATDATDITIGEPLDASVPLDATPPTSD
jgi:hypothetical protein